MTLVERLLDLAKRTNRPGYAEAAETILALQDDVNAAEERANDRGIRIAALEEAMGRIARYIEIAVQSGTIDPPLFFMQTREHDQLVKAIRDLRSYQNTAFQGQTAYCTGEMGCPHCEHIETVSDLTHRLRDLSGSLDTTAVEDGRWTNRAQATLAEAIKQLEGDAKSE